MNPKSSQQDEEFMREAIALAGENMRAGEGGPFGAVIVKDGRVVGRGANNVTSRNDPTAHAEIMAIRQACAALGDFSLKGCTIYSSCEPCPMCLAAIYWARLDKICYAGTQQDAAAAGFDDAFLYREVALPPQARAMKSEHMLRDAACEVFTAWVKKADKTVY